MLTKPWLVRVNKDLDGLRGIRLGAESDDICVTKGRAFLACKVTQGVLIFNSGISILFSSATRVADVFDVEKPSVTWKKVVASYNDTNINVAKIEYHNGT